MIVDDSVIIRTLIARILKTSPAVEIVAQAGDGREAIEQSRATRPDVILLDLEMPVMDGLSAIPHLLHDHPQVQIILCSAQSESGADVTLRGLSLGAADFILKPSSLTGEESKDQFRLGLLERIGNIARQKNPLLSRLSAIAGISTAELSLRPGIAKRPAVIAIGSSTGGPNALMALFAKLRRPDVPIVVTQHMPKMFTKILAEQIGKSGATPCHEGADDMEVLPGHAYVAPGDYHMAFIQRQSKVFIRLDKGPPENFCRPSVDPMLKSLCDMYGAGVLAMILTGMGSDGLEGCRRVVEGGGAVVAQDEESSAVWGMPGAVARAGLCSEIAPVLTLAERVNLLLSLDRRA
jgi:two-component system chemotaxis response regulator CheB